MDIAEKFRTLAEAWAQHCKSVFFSSNIADSLRHPAYRQLIELGPAVVPMIMERYETDEMPWECVLQEITGINLSEDDGPGESYQRRLEWWQKEKAKKPQ